MGAIRVADDDGALRTDNMRRAIPAAPYCLGFVKRSLFKQFPI